MLKKYADGRPVGYPIYLLPSRKADIKRDGHPSRQLHLPHGLSCQASFWYVGLCFRDMPVFFVWGMFGLHVCKDATFLTFLKGSLEYVEAWILRVDYFHRIRQHDISRAFVGDIILSWSTWMGIWKNIWGTRQIRDPMACSMACYITMLDIFQFWETRIWLWVNQTF